MENRGYSIYEVGILGGNDKGEIKFILFLMFCNYVIIENIGCDSMSKIDDINRLIIESKLSGEIFTKEISDGHHTFGELCRHRIILFCTLCNLLPEISWKSKKHFDEENDPMFNDSFIAGINTPEGVATYHIKLKYWEMFDIPEIDRAPKYEQYDLDVVIERVYSLSKIKINNR